MSRLVRTLVRSAAVLLLVGLGLGAEATGSSAQSTSTRSISPLAGEFHPIREVDLPLCLQPLETTQGAGVFQEACNGGTAQNWLIVDRGNNHYSFVNQFSGWCLYEEGEGVGARITQDKCIDSNAEWRASATLPEVVMLTSRAHFRDSNLCLTRGGPVAGIGLLLNTCNGQLSQHWIIGFD